MIDTNTVNIFFFQVKYYFALANMVDANYHARFVSMLITDNAAIWLQSWNLDWDLVV